MNRFGPRKIKERRRITKLAKQARPKAFADAQQLCAAVGPVRIAMEYDFDLSCPAAVIARFFACAAYRGEVIEAAESGALAGFAEYEGRA